MDYIYINHEWGHLLVLTTGMTRAIAVWFPLISHCSTVFLWFKTSWCNIMVQLHGFTFRLSSLRCIAVTSPWSCRRFCFVAPRCSASTGRWPRLCRTGRSPWWHDGWDQLAKKRSVKLNGNHRKPRENRGLMGFRADLSKETDRKPLEKIGWSCDH